MDWSSDDEFEAFLRRFQPSRPKALPTRRRAAVGLAIAAVVVAALVIPARFGSKSPAPDGMGQRGRGNVRPAAARDAAPGADRTPVEAEKGAAVGSSLPTLLPRSGAKPDGSPPSNGPVSATSGAASRRVRVGGAIKPPRQLVRVNPIYPEDAQAAGIQGIVVLECVIGEDGSVIETWVSHSIPELDQAAIAAVSQWVYETTLLNGEPVEVEMTVTIHFTLQ